MRAANLSTTLFLNGLCLPDEAELAFAEQRLARRGLTGLRQQTGIEDLSNVICFYRKTVDR
ncbi:hypothetical protein [Mesotoga sp. BH458_6_3_2_1]|uniref:hypothetical protein n=1 Tax=Mesotoga sp. BH458_6_3_2_1 TaxID=1437446 RepID=UPI0016036B1E|nr:hypothetical protein [Mesotoga sp. BH458_6_3_2_1]